MLIWNKLFLDCFVQVQKYLMKNTIKWYPTVMNKMYPVAFGRDAFICIGFYNNSDDLFYMFFNGKYVNDGSIKHAAFSSITVVSEKDLRAGTYKPIFKTHISGTEDIKDFIKTLEEEVL